MMSKHYRFEPPMDLLGVKAEKLRKLDKDLADLKITGSTPRANLPRHMLIDRLLPLDVASGDIRNARRRIAMAQQIHEMGKIAGIPKFMPAEISMDPWTRVGTRNALFLRVRFPEYNDPNHPPHIPAMTTELFPMRSGDYAISHYTLQNSYPPGEVPEHSRPYARDVLPLALSLALHATSEAGGRHLIVPGTSFVSAHKGFKNLNFRHRLEEMLKRDPDSPVLNRINKEWDKLTEKEIAALTKFGYPPLYNEGFPPHLLGHYYSKIPSRFTRERVKVGSTLPFPGPDTGHEFHKIPTAFSAPLFPYIKKVD